MNRTHMKIVLSVLISLVCTPLWSQNYEADILRFSNNNYSGTARFVALGGAFGSVGADISNFSFNPGGIGMYRTSVVQITAGANYSNYNSTYFDKANQDVKVNAVLPSVGIVFANTKTSKNGLFRSSAFGIAFNRLGEYNYSEKVEVFNTSPGSSLSWNWANEISSVYNGAYVNETSLDEVSFNTYTGFYGYLANFDSAVLDYTSPVVDSFLQTRYLDVKGGKNEMVISAGANYLDKLYFGATIGLPLLNYASDSRFIESDTANSLANTFFNEFELKEKYQTEGIGVNMKFGIIYKINDWIRVGGGFQTPERIGLTERYSSTLTSNFEVNSITGNTNYSIETGEGVFDYRVRLPWKANLGASLFFRDKGFVSADYEAVGYNAMRYTFSNDFKEVSDRINLGLKAKYQVGHNVRVGIEGVINKFRIRGGYAYSGSPIKKEYAVEGFNFSRHTVSGGFGFLFAKIALDFAYQHNVSRQFEQPYIVDNAIVSGVNRSINQGMGIVSLAYKLN
jgi:long-subunit fatty acid transport protein